MLTLDTTTRNRRGCINRLSPRERQVLARILFGQSNGQIASVLDIAATTVQNYQCRIRTKLGGADPTTLSWLLVHDDDADGDCTTFCPVCASELRILKPSVTLRRNERKGGAWCSSCRRAWRAIEREGEGWSIVWDLCCGERTWVLNGRVAE